MKTRKSSRLVSALLALSMLFSMLPVSALANDAQLGIEPAGVADTLAYPTVINLNRGAATADLDLKTNPGDADTYCQFGIATAPATNAPAATALLATATNFQILVRKNNTPRGVLKLKIPAGTYRVFMKVPDISIEGTYAGKLSFTIGGHIGAANGMGSWNYTGGTLLGTYDYKNDGMNRIHMFENTVTLTGEEHQLDITNNYIEEYANNAFTWGAVETLYFVPADVVDAAFSNDPEGTFASWQPLGGPVSAKWAGNYVNQLSYEETGMKWEASTGKVVQWATDADAFSFTYQVAEPTTISYKLLVPQDGMYKVEFTAAKRHKDYGKLHINIAGNDLGYYDFSDTSETNLLTKRLMNVELKAGENTLTVSTNETGEYNTYSGAAVFPKSIKLTRIDENDPDFKFEFDASMEGKLEFIGDTAQVNISGKGFAINPEKLDAAYSTGSGTDDVFKVEQDGNITAQGTGTDTIKVSIKYQKGTDAVTGDPIYTEPFEHEFDAITIAAKADYILAKFSNDTEKKFTDWQSLGGPISAKWAANYVNQLSYATTDMEWASCTGSVVGWSTSSGYFKFLYDTNDNAPTAITYNIEAPQTGTYKVNFVAGATDSTYGKLHLSIDGENLGYYDFSDVSALNQLTKRMSNIYLTEGKHTLTITADDGGKNSAGTRLTVCPKEVYIKLLQSDEPSFEYKFTASLSEKPRYIGDVSEIELVGDSVYLDESKMDIKYTTGSGTNNVFEISEDGKVTAVGAGTDTIKVSSLYEGNTQPVEYNFEPITIQERPSHSEYTIDFAKGLATNQNQLYNVVSIDEHGWEIILSETSSFITDVRFMRENSGSLFVRMPGANEKLTIRTYIPAAGTYDVDFSAVKAVDSGDWEVSVDGEKVGVYSFTAGAFEAGKLNTTRIGRITIQSPGYKTITFREVNGDPAAPSVRSNYSPDALSFVPVENSLPKLEITATTPTKYIGHKSALRFSAKIGDIEVSPLLLGLTYSSSNPGVLTISEDGKSGIEAVGEGTAIIMVSGSYHGQPVKGEAAFTIGEMPSKGEKLTIIFGDDPVIEGEVNDGLYLPTAAVTVPASIEKHGWEVDTESNTTARWYYKADHLHIRPYETSTTAFKVFIPASGYYRFDLTTNSKGTGCVTADVVIDNTYVGWASCYSMSQEEPGETICTNPIKLDSGFHVIKLVTTDLGRDNNAHFFIKKFEFIPLDRKPELESVECTIGNANLYPGEKTPFSAKAIVTGGTAYFFEPGGTNSMTYSSEDEDIATVTPDGTVLALKPGTTKIGATAVIGDKTIYNAVEITIEDNYLKTAAASLSQNTLFPDEKPDEEDEYEYMAKAQIEVKLFLENDSQANLEFADVKLIPVNDKIKIDEDWVLTALEHGESGFNIVAELSGKKIEVFVPVTVSERVNELEYVDLQAEKTTIKIGESIKVIARGMQFNGEASPDGEYEVFYDVQDQSILRIDNNGVITGLAAGNTNVVVHMKKGPFLRSNALLIKVDDVMPPERVYIQSPKYVYEGKAEKLVTIAEFEGGVKTGVLDDAVSYEIVSAQPEQAIDITSDGYIAGVSAGSAQIKANVELGGKSLSSEPFSVTVRESTDEHTIIYDFAKYYPKYADVDPNTIKIEDEGWEINKALTSDYIETVRASYPLRCCFNIGGFSTNITELDKPINSDLAIDFVVGEGESGTYSFDFVGNRNISGGLFAIYIDGEYMGKYDYNQRNMGGTTFNCVNLQEGVHTIVFRAVTGSQADAGYNYIIVGAMRFHRISTGDSFAELDVKVSNPGTLSVGETCAVEASAIMADGRPFAFDPSDLWESKSSLSITSDNPDVLTVDPESGVVTAISEGRANIVVSATIHGYPTKTVTTPITVDNSGIATVTAAIGELSVGESALPAFVVKTEDGRIMDNHAIDFTVTHIADEDTVEVHADGKTLIGKGEGSTTVTYSASLNGCSAECELTVNVKKAVFSAITVTAPSYVMRPDGNGIQLKVSGESADGIELDLTDSVSYTSNNPAVLSVSDTGFVTPAGEIGTGEIVVNATIDGEIIIQTVSMSVRNGKVSSTYYRPDRVAVARENIGRYSWAMSARNTAVQQADRYLKNLDFIYDNITTNELPRTSIMGHRDDPNLYNCKYCGKYWYDVQYNTGPAIMDQLNTPWKVQCDVCRRQFPSNDFWSFYQTGIDENGNWSYELAKQNGSHLLTNDLHPEMGEGWGVDDGYGYRTGNMISLYIADKNTYKTFEEIHYYIAFYNMHIFSSSANGGGLLQNAVTALRDAYVYTGEKKYGRAGAILIDRFADVYPDMQLQPYAAMIGNGVVQSLGKLSGKITDPQLSETYSSAYDAFFDMYDDPEVIDYLSKKAAQFNMENDKTTGEKIRQNCEDGILRGIYEASTDGSFNSNFGRLVSALSLAVLVLDDEEEGGAWLEWMNKDNGGLPFPYNSGGELTPKLVSSVDRDGYGDEGSIAYDLAWGWALGGAAEYLQLYNEINPLADKYNLYKHSRYRKMLLANLPTFLCGLASPQIGDSGQTATVTTAFSPIISKCLLDFFRYTKDPEMAQALYLQSYEDVSDLRYDIFTKNPESAADEIIAAVKKHGEYDAEKSRSLNGFGFSILRDGSANEAASNKYSNQRNFWIGTARGYGHRHPDRLNLGIEAFGINMAPDLGYTRNSSGNEYSYWGHSTLSHNTVIVNEISQSDSAQPGKLLHFDYGKDVQVMDIDASHVYPMTEDYRRSIVMVNIDDTVSYGVDFFRIRGGDDHLYSFHSQSDQVEFNEEVQSKLVAQPMGSYEGPDIPWATSPTITSYSWLDHVRRAKSPQTGNFTADFKIKDFRNNLGHGVETDLHLKMTMVNDFDLDEITVAHGYPSQYRNNPEMFEWVLARRKGKDLDTLFTTVFEPYNGSANIEAIESVPVERIGGAQESAKDVVRAVKVIFNDSKRIDYVVYATNNDVEYRVADLFDFQGFVGVYTTDAEGNLIKAYAHDASKIGDITGANIPATVVDFTRDLEIKNTITISCDVEDVNELKDKYIFIENDGMSNATYDILDAKRVGDNIVLDIGDISTIRSLKNNKDISAGYIYDLYAGAKAEIRSTLSCDNSLRVESATDDSASVGSMYNKTVSATGDGNITYSAVALPRGASLDPETATIKWTPDSHQLGEHKIAIKASDGNIEKTINFKVTVYRGVGDGSSPGNNNSDSANNQGTQEGSGTDSQTPSTGTDSGAGAGAGSGSGSGAGGGGSSTGGDTSGDTETGDNTGGDNNGDAGDGVLDVPGEKFIDLGNYTWAKDAIYSLVDKGVVNGTSENTYSPAANIKRADFAIMLVRAFGITEGEGENFADVDASKYYAEKLRLAKANGIVNGIGNDKFNPEGEISRQDMMLMLCRALEAQGQKLEDADESVLAQFVDAAQISDYARSAVASVVKEGIIAGSNGRINPLEKATRAEIAVMLSRVLAK